MIDVQAKVHCTLLYCAVLFVPIFVCHVINFFQEQLLLTISLNGLLTSARSNPALAHAHLCARLPVFLFSCVYLFIPTCSLFFISTTSNSVLLFHIHIIRVSFFFTLFHVFSFINLLPIICKCPSLSALYILDTSVPS
jgi:hypothetical protein